MLMTQSQSPNKNNIILSLENIKRSFNLGGQNINILKGVNIKVQKGEFIAIMGPSGSGKSTLLNIMGLLDVPTSGTYIYNNKNVTSFNSNQLANIRNKDAGFIFQSFNLLPKMTALDNVVLPSVLGDAENIEKGRVLLEQLGLKDRLTHLPNELSGGQKQRVAIARAMINSPSIIFADEPTGNLDSKSGEEVLKIILKLNKQQGKTIVMVTHDDNISNLADRTIFIKDGYNVENL